MIVTGRFQPFHNAHLNLLRYLKTNYHEHLIICILRRSNRIDLLKKNESALTTYEQLSAYTRTVERNPLPNWQRFRLISLAVESDFLLSKNATIIFRDRPDLNWEKSLIDLPSNRIWVFNALAGEFDKSKVEYYKTRDESVRIVELNSELHGQDIRMAIRDGSEDFSFLPAACVEYFKNECLQYIKSTQKETK